MLSNEKYKGVVRLFDDKKSEVQYLVSDNHPAIITEEIFEAVQKEKANRSNIVVDEKVRQLPDPDPDQPADPVFSIFFHLIFH